MILVSLNGKLILFAKYTDCREDGAGEENRLENAPSLRYDGWQFRFGIVIVSDVRHEADQETRLRRFLNHFFIGAQV